MSNKNKNNSEKPNTQEQPQESSQDRLVSLLEQQKEALDAQAKKIERLEYAASKKNLSRFDDMNRKKKERHISVRFFDGKPVVGWHMTKNVCEKNANGVWVEDQRLVLKYEDGTESEEMEYISFERNYLHKKGVVEKIHVDEDRYPIGYDIRITDDSAGDYYGKLLSIGANFVN